MSRFADSPYFLLNDFMTALVAPPNAEYIQSDVVNLYKRNLFTDVIWIGGTNVETSSNLDDTLLRYPLFNPTTDQANIFTGNVLSADDFVDNSVGILDDGVYVGLATTTNGSGVGATVTITIVGNVVDSVVTNVGDFVAGYKEGDTLTVDATLVSSATGGTFDSTMITILGDVAWNAWIERSPIANYHIDDTLPYAGILRGGDVFGSIVVDGGPYIDVYAKLDEYGFVPVRLQPVYETPADKKYFRFDSVLVTTLNYDGTVVEYDSDGGSCSTTGICSSPEHGDQTACELNGGVWYADAASNKLTCELNGGVWTESGNESVFDSRFVSIQSYDHTYDNSPIKWQDLELSDILSNGNEIYFRKDSSFHDWLKNFASEIYETQYEIDFVVRNYVNTDQRFLYFGEIFPTDGGKYHIVFNGLKDWVQAALPENNRTPNLVEFLDAYFDQVYVEGYQLLKNIWSLRDGRECDQKFVGYIPTFHGMPKEDEIPDWYLESYREYAAELVWLMKRKGTYASMRIIFEVLGRNSNNIFNVIERWHTDDTGIITDYQDHIYTALYGVEAPDGSAGAGTFWYSKFDTASYPEGYLAADNKVLSPFYRVDLDLAVEPMTSFSIMPEQLSYGLYENWELQRPVNRQAEYNLIYAPITDLSGREFSLYDKPNSGQSITKSLDNLVYDDNNYIHLQVENVTDWVINHTLATTDMIITSYSSAFEKQIPSSIEVIDEYNVVVKFDFPATGVVIVSRASNISLGYDPINWRIRHGLNRKEIIWQVRDSNENVYYPMGGYIADNNTVSVVGAIAGSSVFVKPATAVGDSFDLDGDGDDDSTITDDVWVFDTVGKITTDYVYDGEEWIAWVIDHDYQTNAFQTECYDALNNRVEPHTILFNELDGGGGPQMVVLWAIATALPAPDVNDYIGFAAISDVGDVVSFYGVIPRNAAGDLLSVEWRITVETDDEIFTFLEEGSSDAITLFAGKEDKTIHYYDKSDPTTRPFISGTVELREQDLDAYYYTFYVKKEGLLQIDERNYNITALEIVNTRIKRRNKDRIVYSRMSGIFKPHGVNFVGHVRVLKDASEEILDTFGLTLYDTENEPLYDIP